MNKTTLWVIIVIIVVVAAWYFFFRGAEEVTAPDAAGEVPALDAGALTGEVEAVGVGEDE